MAEAETAAEMAAAMTVSGLSSFYSAVAEMDLDGTTTAVAADVTTAAASIDKEEAAQCSPFYI